mgnify:CR=1 FL=1
MKILSVSTINTQKDDKITGRLLPLFTNQGKTEVYISTIYPNAFKGFHIHNKQTVRFSVIRGEVMLMIIDPQTKVKSDIYLTSNDLKTVEIEPRLAIGIRGLGDTESYIVFYPDPAYDPSDEEQYDYQERQTS